MIYDALQVCVWELSLFHLYNALSRIMRIERSHNLLILLMGCYCCCCPIIIDFDTSFVYILIDSYTSKHLSNLYGGWFIFGRYRLRLNHSIKRQKEKKKKIIFYFPLRYLFSIPTYSNETIIFLQNDIIRMSFLSLCFMFYSYFIFHLSKKGSTIFENCDESS